MFTNSIMNPFNVIPLNVNSFVLHNSNGFEKLIVM